VDGAVDEVSAAVSYRPAHVRDATRADQARLEHLRDRANALTADVRGGPMYLDRHPVAVGDFLGDDPQRRAWLGGLDGAELGFVLGAIATLSSGGQLGVIEAIYVDPRIRGCGVGEALMAAALEWFTSCGCRGAEASALPGSRETKNFFEDHGLKARLLTVYRSLEPGTDPPG
jgi:GNAT superfamily N-acetyltransferase